LIKAADGLLKNDLNNKIWNL